MTNKLLEIAILVCSVGAAVTCYADVFDVYIAAGQSNMDGRGFNSDLVGPLASYAAAHPNVLLHYTNPRDPVSDAASRPTYQSAGWVPLQPGYAIQPGFTTGGALPATRFGPEVSFGRAMAENTPDRKVAIIKVSRGATNLSSNWDPSNEINGPKGYMYAAFETVVPQAIQALQDLGHSVEIRGMIWHQGEGDGSGDSPSTQAAYEANLTEFILAVRQELGYPNLPFLIGELESVDGGREAVRAAQSSVAQAMDFVEFVPSTGLQVADGTHFTSASVIEFGQRFATKMQTAISHQAGDYNRDKSVGNSDYNVWRSHFGSVADARADGNSDRVVNAADYVLWRDRYGTTAPPALAFSENFDDIALTANPLPLTTTTVGNSFKKNVTPTSTGAANVRIDAHDYFGLGTTNQYLEFVDGDSTAGMRGATGTISGTAFQVSFDFYDPSGDGSTAGNRLILGDGAGTSNSSSTSRSVDIELRNGSLRFITGGATGSANTAGAYTEDTKHSVRIVGNYSSSAYEYDFNGTQSVAPGAYDIWVNGVLLVNGDDVPFRNAVFESTHIGLSGNGAASLSTTFFDNFVVEIFPVSTSGNSAVVPEPTTYVLTCIVSVGFGAFPLQKRCLARISCKWIRNR